MWIFSINNEHEILTFSETHIIGAYFGFIYFFFFFFIKNVLKRNNYVLDYDKSNIKSIVKLNDNKQ